eukprot:8149467-Heterocapsa_arctica.AAC.1
MVLPTFSPSQPVDVSAMCTFAPQSMQIWRNLGSARHRPTTHSSCVAVNCLDSQVLDHNLAAPNLVLNPQQSRIQVPNAPYAGPLAHADGRAGVSAEINVVVNPQIDCEAPNSHAFGCSPNDAYKFRLRTG